MMRHKKLKGSTVIVHLLLLVLVVINLFPLYWMMTFSCRATGAGSTTPKR